MNKSILFVLFYGISFSPVIFGSNSSFGIGTVVSYQPACGTTKAGLVLHTVRSCQEDASEHCLIKPIARRGQPFSLCGQNSPITIADIQSPAEKILRRSESHLGEKLSSNKPTVTIINLGSKKIQQGSSQSDRYVYQSEIVRRFLKEHAW